MPDSLIGPDQGNVLATVGSSAELGVSGYGGVAFQIQGTFDATLTFEARVGSEWAEMRVTASDNSSPVTTTTDPGIYIGSAVGFTSVRAVMTARTSGSAYVLIRADVASPGGAGGGGGSGTDVNLVSVGGDAIQLGQADMAHSFPVAIASDQSAIPVTVTGGGGGGTASDFGDPFPSSGTAAGIADPDGTMQPLSLETFDYNTGAGTVPVTALGIAIPAGSGPLPVLGGHGTATQALRVELPTDGTGVIATVGAVTAITNALPAGSNVIGHVIADSGSTTAVTGNVTVVQPTASSLNATVVGTGTLAVQNTQQGTASQNVAQIGGNSVVTGGTNGTLAVGGIQAHDAAASGNNPVNLGAIARSSEPGAVSNNGDIANLITDLVGKLIVLPYANPENFVSGAITSAMTGTTSTSLISAPASGLRNYITQITVSNASTTVPTDILIQDGSGGTTLYVIPCPAGTGTGTGASGATVTFPTPLRQPTTATAIYVANVTTGSSTKVSASGYKGA